MNTGIQKAVVLILALSIVVGGFLCLLSADSIGNHMMGDEGAGFGMHLSFANDLSRAISPSVFVLVASLILLSALFVFFISEMVQQVLPSVAYRYRYRQKETRTSEQTIYSWLSLLVRSPGIAKPA